MTPRSGTWPEPAASPGEAAPARGRARFVIDVHQHWLPPQALAAGRGSGFRQVDERTWVMETRGVCSLIHQDYYDIELASRVNAEAGVDLRILVPSMQVTGLSAMTGMPMLDASKSVHDMYAELIAAHPGPITSLASVSPFEPAGLAEAERAIKGLGFKGLCLESSWAGRFYDTEDVYPYFEFAEANGYTIYMHPPQLPYGFEIMNKWRLEEVAGRPADTAMSVARMIFSGLLDRFPDIKIVLAHMGGDLIPILGRLDFGHRLGYHGLPAEMHARNELQPSDYIRRNFYADTMGFNLPMLTAAATVFGPGRLMFGSDYGPVPISPAEHISLVSQLPLTVPQREDIFWRTASRQFSLSPDTAAAARG